MSYFTIEKSTDSGQPLELYEFVEGTNYFYYTNAAEDVEIEGVTYKSCPVTRSSFEVSSEVSKGSLKLTFPVNHEFASRYLIALYDNVTTVVVKRKHFQDDPWQYVVYWRGRVVAGTATGGVIELSCESVFTSMRRHGVRARYQRNCRHALYGYDCGLSLSAFEVDGTISGIDGLTLTIAEAALSADGTYVGGLLRLSSGGSRLITSHTGTQITVARQMTELENGLVVKISPGCDHLKATCKEKFNNLDNFGGYPFMPLKNPFGGTSLV